MFKRESEMTGSAEQWMRAQGLSVKAEFNTPWGACDLVGVRLNQERVARRIGLRQTRAIGSITRAAVLLRVPDVETRRSASLDSLVNSWGDSVPTETLCDELERLVADRFLLRSSTGRLQKLNGWMPLQDRIVAVELKLTRIEEAMQQAHRNLGFADESFVAFPKEVAVRVASNLKRWSVLSAGVGLLSVTPATCEVLVPARRAEKRPDPAIQVYCVEKFWRTRLRDSSA